MNDKILRVDSDGLEIVVEVVGNGPPLVAAHGLSGNRHMMRRQFRNLTDRYQVIMYDQRGHSDSSPVTNPSLYDPDRMAEDMGAVMDALSIDKAIVEGESMGAATTLLFALKYPQRVSTVLLTGPAFGDQINPDVESLHQMALDIQLHGKEEYMKLVEKRMRDEWNAPDEVVEAVQFMQGSHQQDSLVTALDTVKDWIIFDDLSEIGVLSVPVCIIAWPDDPLHPIELARRMVDVLPNATLYEIPSVSHVFINQGAIIGETYAHFLDSIKVK